MIVDRLENLGRYRPLYPQLVVAEEFLRTFVPGAPDGRIDLGREGCHALVQTFLPDPPERRRFEGHRRHLDVQCVLEGRERIDVTLGPHLEACPAYDPLNDIAFFPDPPVYSSLVLAAGTFALFVPEDIHRPCVWVGAPAQVRKVVFKIPASRPAPPARVALRG